MKLFTRYNRFNLVVMALLFALSGTVHYFLIKKALVGEVDESLGKYQKQIVKYIRKNNALPVLKNFEEVQISYRKTGKQQERKIKQAYLYNAEDDISENFRQLIFSEQLKGNWYEIGVAKPLDGTTVLTKTITYSTLTMLLVIVVFSVLLNHLIIRKLWKPFYAAMNEMKSFKLGNKKGPVLPESDIDEFSLMNKSLSHAINSAKNDYRILKEFTENASHETQTPLAIIRSKLDLVIQDEGLSEAQSDALKSAYAAVSRLSKLNQSLLLLAKIENQQFTATEQINLKERVQEKLLQFNEFLEGNQITVNCTLDPSVVVANAELTDILLNNLLSNACRHNIKGGEISILLISGRLEIANTATHSSLDTAKLFNRFYKEAQSSRHNGLGLSIVKQICDHSGIHITYNFLNELHHFTLEWTVS